MVSLSRRVVGLLCFALGITLMGCGGMVIRYYTFSDVDFSQGMLLGEKPKDDRPFSDCTPTEQDANPCVTLFTPEFLSLKKEYLDCRARLEECERRCD